jgi:hypothetical protein
MQAALERQPFGVSTITTLEPTSMHTDLRYALNSAYERMKFQEPSPAAFAASYALSLGIIMGGETCKGMSVEEAAVERAYVSMLAALYEIRLGVQAVGREVPRR